MGLPGCPELELEDPVTRRIIDDVGKEVNLSKAMDMLFSKMTELPSYRPFLLVLMIM